MLGHMRNAIENAATVLLLLAVAAVTGYFGFAGVIGDRGPGESLFERNALVLGFAISGAVLIGLLLPRFWYFSITASWGSLLALVSMAAYQPIETLRHFFDAGAMSVWAVFSAPAFAVLSGYVGAYVGRRFWGESDASRPASQIFPPVLATTIAILLVILSAWLLANTTGFPPPYYRTEIDSVFFALQLLIIRRRLSWRVDILRSQKVDRRTAATLQHYGIWCARRCGPCSCTGVSQWHLHDDGSDTEKSFVELGFCDCSLVLLRHLGGHECRIVVVRPTNSDGLAFYNCLMRVRHCVSL